MKLLMRNILLVLMLVMPTAYIFKQQGLSSSVYAADSAAEDPVDGTDVEDDDGSVEEQSEQAATQETLEQAAKEKAEREKAPRQDYMGKRGFRKRLRVTPEEAAARKRQAEARLRYQEQQEREAREEKEEQEEELRQKQAKEERRQKAKEEGKEFTEDEDDEQAEREFWEQKRREEEAEEARLKPSPDADTTLLFTQPAGLEFPAGKEVRMLVGFTNKGSEDFIIDSMEASFRYPQDYSFYIQNFTGIRFDQVVESKRQATFEYRLTPSDTFNARPFGLTVNLNYKTKEGNFFQDAVFNDTVTIVEADDGLDGETFFLYVFLVALAILILVGAQQLLVSVGKKRLPQSRHTVEMGTQNKGEIDYDWIPRENLDKNKKSPGRTPNQSPRNRRAKRRTGSAED